MNYKAFVGFLFASISSVAQFEGNTVANLASNVSYSSAGTMYRKSNIKISSHESETTLKGFAPEGINVQQIPLFGNYQKTVDEIKTDTDFVLECQSSFTNRAEASDFFCNMGWQYLAEGKKEDAIQRFNYAYLLDDENEDLYWGLGVVEYQRNNYETAIRMMRKGLEIAENDNVTLIVDLATVYIKCFVSNQHPDDLKSAYDLLDLAISIQPEFANAYMQKALALMVNGEIDKAWTNFHQGYEIEPAEASPEILSELLTRKCDPKGVFKAK